MPKYQLIFDSATVIPDDEFEEIIKPFIDAHPEFKFCYANNVMGFRKELIEKRDQILTQAIDSAEKHIAEVKGVTELAFQDLSDLFKIGDKHE